MGNNNRSEESASTFILESAAIVGAILFVTGWNYARGYYGAFNVSLGQIEIDVEHYFVWTYGLVIEHWVLSSGLAVITLLIGWALYKAFKQLQLAILVTLLFLLAGLPAVGGYSGRIDGERDAHGETTILPVAKIILAPQRERTTTFALASREIRDGDEYFYLGKHKGLYYFVPDKLSGDSLLPNVILISEELVGGLTIHDKPK